MNGVIATFLARVRAVSRDARAHEVYRHPNGREALIEVSYAHAETIPRPEKEMVEYGRMMTFLLVVAPNIASCKGLWWCDTEVKGQADAVCVFYGYAATEGAVADCGGNVYKDDYRRLAYVEAVRRADPVHPVFQEVPWLMSEENLLRCLRGEPLR